MALLRPLLQGFTGVSLLAFALIYLWIPTRSAARAWGSYYSLWEKYQAFSLVLSLAGAFLGFMALRLLKELRSVTSPWFHEPLKIPLDTKGRAFQLILSAIILARTLWGADGCFDWDEIERICQITQGNFWYVLNPLTTLNHPLGTALSIGSSKILGFSKLGFRLPSMVFCTVFLVFLNWFCVRFLSRTASLILFLHLSASAFVSWYFHSMRGYVTMMFFSGLILALIWEGTRNGFHYSARWLTVFLLSLTALLFCHAFGGLFAVCSVLALFLWLYANRYYLERGILLRGMRLTALSTLIIVLAGVLFVSQVYKLDASYGFLFVPKGKDLFDASYKIGRLNMVFGMSVVWGAKLILILALAALVVRFREGDALNDFLTFLVVVGASVVTANFLLLKVQIIEGRMLLAFLVPLVAWMGESFFRARSKSARLFLCTALLGVLTLPQILYGKGLLVGDLGHFEEHESFTRNVVEQLRGKATLDCLSFSGEPRAAFYSKFYYLRELRSPNAPVCQTRYHLHFGKDQFENLYPLRAETETEARLLITDGKGRSLYEVSRDPQIFAQLLSEG